MAIHRYSIFGPMQDDPQQSLLLSLRLAPTVRNDVFLSALLEMSTTAKTARWPRVPSSPIGSAAQRAARIEDPLHNRYTRLAGRDHR